LIAKNIKDTTNPKDAAMHPMMKLEFINVLITGPKLKPQTMS
jgi:hypothetical protein